MVVNSWLSDNYVEVFGAVTGIIYVFLEIRQNLWLWPVGIITSAVYIWIFFTGKLYADMSLQGYYLVISILGWYWWLKGTGRKAEGGRQEEKNGGKGEGEKGPSFAEASEGKRGGEGESEEKSESRRLVVTRLKLRTGLSLIAVFILLYATMWFALDRLTDSPVPEWDSFITSLSIVATWMLAKKIYEHWYLWIVVNTTASILFFSRHLYPTLVLYIIYGIMSYTGLKSWKKTIVSK